MYIFNSCLNKATKSTIMVPKLLNLFEYLVNFQMSYKQIHRRYISIYLISDQLVRLWTECSWL